jgi:hypothetical protein
MRAERQQETDKRVWEIADRLRGREFRGPEHVAAFLQAEHAELSASELIALGYILVTRFGRYMATTYVPEWLAGAVTSLLKGSSPKTICDPLAGIGVLIGVLREALSPQTALALTWNTSEMQLGKVLVPQADWRIGNPVALLEKIDQELDVVASIPPMVSGTSQTLRVDLPSGGVAEIADDIGTQIMVASALRLSPNGVGLYVLKSSIFSSTNSVVPRLRDWGLGIEGAFALPAGTFEPFTAIPTYLLVVRRMAFAKMFVGQLSSDTKTNLQVIANFRQGVEGGSLELGRFVEPDSFQGIDYLRAAEGLRSVEQRFGVKASKLAELGDVKSDIKLGRPGEDFAFEPVENAIYIPLIGNSDVVESPDALTLKPHNYAQVVIDTARSNAHFVAQFLNSEVGRELRDQSKTGVIPKLSKQILRELRVLVPDLQTQRRMIEIETRITNEQNTVMSLQNEIVELRRELWSNPQSTQEVAGKIDALAMRLAGGIKQHTSATLDQWFEMLPFPLASIFRAWQATPSQDFKTKCEHLLHFFEAAAEFVSVILLSAFSSNQTVFAAHRQKLTEAMQRQSLSFSRASFGTWKLVVEYLGKQTRELLSESGKKPDDAKNDRALCADIFADQSLSLPSALARKELASIFSTTNKMRNDWGGHGGVVGQAEAELRNQQLLGEVQKLREAMADTWVETQMIHALHCRPRRDVFENEVAVLMGSNSEFLKETRAMAMWMDVERLYLSKKDSGKALKLLPLIQVGPSPQSAKNACYFFSRLERDGARFVSYHFTDKPELKGPFADAAEAIKVLTEI